MKRLAIVSTHPIQYNAPLFRLLAKSDKVHVKVFYTWSQAEKGEKYDPGFGKNVAWDIPLLEGYEYEFIENVSKNPGSHHFRGIINPGLTNTIKAWQPDVVLLYGWSFYSHLRLMMKLSGKIPVLFRGDSHTLDEKGSLKQSLRKTALRWIYSHIDYAYYVGTNNKTYFEQAGLRPHQLVHIPHSIDNSRFQHNSPELEKQAAEWRKNLAIPEDAVVFLYAGKFEEVKNLPFLIDTFRSFSSPGARLVLAGNGPLETELKKLSAGDNRIIFLDFQNQSKMPVLYRLGHVFVLLSQSETWGLGINEAMACGSAIVCSHKVGGAVDLVKHGSNGFIVSTDKAEALLEAMKILAEDQEFLQAAKTASLYHIKKQDVSVAATAILKHIADSFS